LTLLLEERLSKKKGRKIFWLNLLGVGGWVGKSFGAVSVKTTSFYIILSKMTEKPVVGDSYQQEQKPIGSYENWQYNTSSLVQW